MVKKVIHLISTDAFSGAENVACQIINMYKDSTEYDMIYVSKIDTNKQALDTRNIKYYKLEKFDYKNVKKAIEELKPDIIHAHDIKASIMASCFYKKAKIISHIHANHENMRKLNLKTLIFKITSKKYNKIIWVSQTAFNNYRFAKRVKEKSCVLYNVINSLEIQNKIKLDSNIYDYDIIYLGRLTYQKDPIRLIDIIKKLIVKNPNVKVAIVGDGELYDTVKSKIKSLNLEKNIKLYGFIINPYKILNSSKIMLMTSIYEGTPMCALEAIACGIPIVSTPTDGLKEIVIDGKTGYLSDDDEVIVEKIDSLLNNKSYFSKIKSNVKELNEEINSTKKYKETMDQIYK